MTMGTFVEFWKGMFFFVSTLMVSVIFYLVVVKWQPLWTEGFKDFGDISGAIMRLDKTAKPVAEMAPLMLGEMDAMRQVDAGDATIHENHRRDQSERRGNDTHHKPHDLGHGSAHGDDEQ